MKIHMWLIGINLLLGLVSSQKITDVSLAQQFLDSYEIRASDVFYRSSITQWIYMTNLTHYNQEQYVTASLRKSQFNKEAAQNASQFDWENFETKMKRLFGRIADAGIGVLSEADVHKYKIVESDLDSLYSKAKVCNKPGDTSDKCYPLDPDLTALMLESRDWDTLLWAWKGWHEATGPFMKDKYVQLASLENLVARTLGHSDASDWWIHSYESDRFDEDIARIWEQLKPLYVQLHAYIRKKLKSVYGPNDFPQSGHIPAHLLSNMWAQEWTGLSDITLPYPNEEALDITAELLQQNYTVVRMFETAEGFFTSLGMPVLPQKFWDHSMLKKPEDGRAVVCHASAWDFYNKQDFRVKMCTVITNENLETIHHEMGHIYYGIMYKDQPVKFRRGANPGFHEAIGDVMSLSSSTPEHLHKIGLLSHIVNSTEHDLNYLMSIALQKIAFLPFGYLIDQWRWSVFRGETPPSEYNKKWWDLRCSLQGLYPPVPRSYDGFDAGSKYHIPGNTPYIRYFVSYILQFQFHKALCQAANHTGALHRCDIFQSAQAGEKLRSMMSLGSSVPWQDALEQITGTRVMDASALMEYFQPIITWLEAENQGEEVGWDEDTCPPGSFDDPHVYSSSTLRTQIQWTTNFCVVLCIVVINMMYKM